MKLVHKLVASKPFAVVGSSVTLTATIRFAGLALASTDTELAAVQWLAMLLSGVVALSTIIAVVVLSIRSFQTFVRDWQDPSGLEDEAVLMQRERMEGMFSLVMEWLLAVLVILVVLMGIASYRRPSLHVSRTDMTGKVVIITDSCAGRGFLHAEMLAKWNAEVIVTCADEKEAASSAARIVDASANSKVHGMKLDLLSIGSVRAFAQQFAGTHTRLDVLVNSADVCVTPGENVLSADGLDSVLQTNYVSHAILTELLLPLLRKSSGSRIVHVSADAHANGYPSLPHASLPLPLGQDPGADAEAVVQHRLNRRHMLWGEEGHGVYADSKLMVD